MPVTHGPIPQHMDVCDSLARDDVQEFHNDEDDES